MAEPQGVVRVNISVPRELKARMDAASKGVNWSAIAAQAFERKLLETESEKEPKNMQEVIERLKAAQEIEANEDYQAGYKAGEVWAKRFAKPKELRRIAEFINDENRRGEWWDADNLDDFAGAAWPSVKNDPRPAESFFEYALGEDAERVHDNDFFRGFGEGVCAVWEGVADKL